LYLQPLNYYHSIFYELCFLQSRALATILGLLDLHNTI